MARKTGARRKPMTADAMSRSIGAIWSDLLGKKMIRNHHDFFELGGDSVLAMNMLFEIEAALGLELPPSILFDNPTFSEFCRAAREFSP